MPKRIRTPRTLADPRLAGGIVIHFGTFEGWTPRQVGAFEPSWLAWAVGQRFVRAQPNLYRECREALIEYLLAERAGERCPLA